MKQRKGNESLQMRALQLYQALGRSLVKLAETEGMPSRQTLHSWRKNGKPESITGGKPWDMYLNELDRDAAGVVKQREIDDGKSFLEFARETLEKTVREIRKKVDVGDFEAKPADIDKMVRLYMMIDQRDAEKKAWMDACMLTMLTIMSEIVTPQQFNVIKTRFLDLNAKKSGELELLQVQQIPKLPTHEEAREIYVERIQEKASV